MGNPQNPMGGTLLSQQCTTTTVSSPEHEPRSPPPQSTENQSHRLRLPHPIEGKHSGMGSSLSPHEKATTADSTKAQQAPEESFREKLCSPLPLIRPTLAYRLDISDDESDEEPEAWADEKRTTVSPPLPSYLTFVTRQRERKKSIIHAHSRQEMR